MRVRSCLSVRPGNRVFNEIFLKYDWRKDPDTFINKMIEFARANDFAYNVVPFFGNLTARAQARAAYQ